jgi:8-oxo-dGTP diphosphatase
MNKLSKLKKNTPEPCVGVGGILFNENREVLLIKRNQPPAQGLWSIPGGKLEPGESIVEACQREFHEETSLVVTVRHIVAVVDRQLEGFHYVIIDFCVELIDKTNCVPLAQSDVLDAKWVSLDEIGSHDLVIGLVDIIDRAYSRWVTDQLGGLQDINKTGTDFF